MPRNRLRIPTARQRRHQRRRLGRQSGVTLLEVVLAIALLVTGGLATIAAVSEGSMAAARVWTREHDLREASRFLEAVALWTRTDLDLRLGERPQGPWRLRIDRLTPTLYDLTLLDSTGGRVLLHTAVFRSPRDAISGGQSATP